MTKKPPVRFRFLIDIDFSLTRESLRRLFYWLKQVPKRLLGWFLCAIFTLCGVPLPGGTLSLPREQAANELEKHS